MTESKIARFVREGRGTGEGAQYRPWLTTHDLSSLGRSTRMLSRRHRRVHHLFSDIEKGAFLSYDWRDDVADVREQFPLDRGLTRVIAAEAGIRHPRDPHSRVDVVMTTDLLVTFADGSLLSVACKTSEGLRNRRAMEKLEIERLYWARLGRRWALWTERSISKVRVGNLAYLHEFVDADRRHWLEPGHWRARATAFHAMLRRADFDAAFAEFAGRFDALPGFGPGEAVSTMRYLACWKLIGFDLDVAFDQSRPLGRSISLVEGAPAMVVAA